MGEVTELKARLAAGEITPEQALERAKTAIKNTSGRKFTPPSEEALLEMYDQDEKMRERALKAQIPFLSDDTGFVLYPGLVLIGGVSGRGKSTLAANILAGFLSTKESGEALVISNEESLGSIYNRVACILLQLSFFKFHNGRYPESTKQQVRATAAKVLKRVKVCQVSGWDMSVMEDVQAMLEYAAESGGSLALADYYQTVNTSRKEAHLESFQVHKRFGFWLKDYSKKVPMPIVMFAQLKTDSEEKEIKDRIENDRTIVNHAFQVLEVIPDFDAMNSNFKMHKDRFGGQTNKDITMSYREGRFEMEGRPVTPEQKSKRSRSARARGKRAEYGLRNYLRQLGWQAERVPSSGASKGFPGDVRAVKGERSLLFEVKNHSESFSQFWVLLDRWRQTGGDDLLSIAVPGAAHLCCDISLGLEALFDGDGVYTLMERHPLYPEFKRTFNRLPTLSKLAERSDILVLKDNHRPWLFLRFR
jgi:energy-coupling factor transporter ATP-binding protein EcfA2